MSVKQQPEAEVNWQNLTRTLCEMSFCFSLELSLETELGTTAKTSAAYRIGRWPLCWFRVSLRSPLQFWHRHSETQYSHRSSKQLLKLFLEAEHIAVCQFFFFFFKRSSWHFVLVIHHKIGVWKCLINIRQMRMHKKNSESIHDSL